MQRKLGIVACTCHPSIGVGEREELAGFLKPASQPASQVQLICFRVNEWTCLENSSWRAMEERHLWLTSGLYTHVKRLNCTHTHTHPTLANTHTQTNAWVVRQSSSLHFPSAESLAWQEAFKAACCHPSQQGLPNMVRGHHQGRAIKGRKNVLLYVSNGRQRCLRTRRSILQHGPPGTGT